LAILIFPVFASVEERISRLPVVVGRILLGKIVDILLKNRL
jgi:hypothetical protein